MSWRLVAINLVLRLREKPYLAHETDYARARRRMEAEALKLPMPAGARFDDAPLGRVPTLRIAGPEDSGPVILWLHGGAYILGSPRTHAAMLAALADRASAGAVLPDYRLAPEHPFPAALQDARAAWDALIAEGVAPARIVLGGDSAGGGLAFALLHLLLADGVRPGAALSFSPWADLTCSNESLRTLARRDVLVPARRMAEIRDLYLNGADPCDPCASPVFGRFAGAPPVLIQSSRVEVLRDDARAMAARLRADGADVVHEEEGGVPHVWQLYQRVLPEADAALDRAAAFVTAALARPRS